MKKMSANVLHFAQGNMDLFEAFGDFWDHYRNKKLGKTNIEYNTQFSLDQKEKALNELLVKYIVKRSQVAYAADEPLERWFNHPNVTFETFGIINALIDFILPQTIIDSIGAYTDVKVGGWGDSFAFDVSPRDLFVVTKSGKAQRQSEVKKQFKGQVTMLPEAHQITVGVELYRVLAGKESLAEFVAKAVQSIETQMTLDVYNAFATAMGNVDSTATTGLLVAGYTQSDLVRLAEQVTVWNNGAKAIVMGTALALQNVLPDDANYRYFLNDPYVTLGYIQTLAGYDLMRLPQVADWTTPFGRVLSDSTLWVVSPGAQKIVKLCMEGNTLSTTNQPFDNANLTQNTTMTKFWTAGIATNAVAGELTL